MLSDITPTDIAAAKNFYVADNPSAFEGAQDMLFVDSFERIAEGLYYTGFTFGLLGKDIIKSEYPFDVEARVIAEQLFSPDHPEGFFGSPEHLRLRAALTEIHTKWPDYGVCDYPEQVLEKFPHFKTDPRRFLISFQEISPERHDDFKWHKYGSYINSQPDEDGYFHGSSKPVFLFNVFELNPISE